MREQMAQHIHTTIASMERQSDLPPDEKNQSTDEGQERVDGEVDRDQEQLETPTHTLEGYVIPSGLIEEIVFTNEGTFIKLPPIPPEVFPLQASQEQAQVEERDATPDTMETPVQPLNESETAWLRPRSSLPRILQIITVSAILVALVAGTLSSVLGPWLMPHATIIITPTGLTQSLDTTLTIVSEHADPIKGEIAGRLLPQLAFSQEMTTRATGTGHEPPQAAHGAVILYNAALTSQFVPAGTILMAANGVQVETETDVTIAASTIDTKASATVTAHALLPGPAGNLAAGALYGFLLRSTIIATNETFSGGQDARDFTMVKQSDIDGALASITATLDAMITASYQSQIQSSETVITPLSCSLQRDRDHKAGDEATTVHLSLKEQCSPLVYSTSVLSDLISHRLDGAMAMLKGVRYLPTGSMQLTVSLKSQAAGRAVLQVKASQRYHYQFTEKDTANFAALVAGLPIEQARRKLLAVSGIDDVSISVKGWQSRTLPQDASFINFVLFQ